MSRRHTADTRRIQARLERWELTHLRTLAAERAAQIDLLQEELADTLRRLHIAEDTLDDQWRRTIEMGERMEEAGTGHLGLTIDGALCVITGSPPQLALSS